MRKQLSPEQKERKRITHAAWRERNREKLRERAREYWKEYCEKCPEKAKAKSRNYWRKNKDRIQKRRSKHSEKAAKWQKQWRQENSSHKKNVDKAYKAANKERIAAVSREYWKKEKSRLNSKRLEKYRADIAYRLKCLLRSRLRNALKSANLRKNNRTVGLVGCTIRELISHLESQFTDGMSWKTHGFKGWHIDHIIPVCAFDLNSEEQIRKCFHWSNLRPLWSVENMKKGGRIESLDSRPEVA